MAETDATRARDCESPVDEPLHLRQNERGERRTWIVVVLTFVMMVAEVSLGYVYNSMALTADGWHMGSHVAALGNTALIATNSPATTGAPTCESSVKMNLNTSHVSHSGTMVNRPVIR